MQYSDSLGSEYVRLFETCRVRLDKLPTIEQLRNRLLGYRNVYETAVQGMRIPWWFVGLLHGMESTFDLTTHLHNGDPLAKRTTHVPAGRPRTSRPPYLWEESARDALAMQGLTRCMNWTLPYVLYRLERYNGWGYRKPLMDYPYGIKTPYLWSYSNHYGCGKYIADGTYSPTAVSRQCGAGVLLRRLVERGDVPLSHLLKKDASIPWIAYSDKIVLHAKDLQFYLNGLPGVALLVDGIPGRRTSAAFYRVHGYPLKGDPKTTT